MADRSVRVVLSAITAPFQAGMAKATASAKAMEIQLGRTSRAGKATQGAFMGMGKGSMVAMGGATLGAYALVKGLVSTTKAAIDFESSFAGIRKTVDASEAEFQALEDGMRRLAQEIPVSVNELNRIGELGGQLGVAKESLVDFTKTVALMGVTTDLSVEEAATSFAQFANITQMPQSQFENLGAAIVALGNNGASTEQELVEFGKRIAGAGEIAGFTEGEILGVGNAVASLGVNAEAGGTAVQKVMLKITESVELGDDKLQGFADAAGMSASEFTTAWRKDPAKAFVAFTEGLGKAGTGAIGILKELGLTDQRLTRAFLALGTSGDDLRKSIELGNAAFRDANALQDEAAKRFETTESKVLLAKNQIEELKIAMGEGLAVAVGDMAQKWTDHMLANARYNDSLKSTVDLLRQLAHGTDVGTVSQDRFIQSVMGNLPLLEQRLGEAPKTIADLRKELELMVGDVESSTLWERLGNWGRAEAGEMEFDQAQAVLELVKAMDEGAPIVDEFGNEIGDAGEEAKQGGKGASEAARGFDKLFKTGKDFRKWRDSARDSLSDLSGAFGKLADDANITADELIAAFQEQIVATRDFKKNLNILISRGAKPALIQDLIDMGDQGALWAKGLAEDNEAATKAFIRSRTESGRELNSLTGLVAKAQRNVTGDFDKIGSNVKRNTDKAVEGIDSLRRALMGLPAHTKVTVEQRVEQTGSGKVPLGGPTAAGIFGGRAVSMAQAAINAVPGAQAISSTYRTPAQNAAAGGSSSSYHLDANNPAADIVGANLPGVFGWLAAMGGGRETIYGHSIMKGGRMGFYAPDDHFDHVHHADMGAVVRGPAWIHQGNITEAHIPLSGPGAKGLTLSGVLHIPGIGPAILEGARLEMGRQGHANKRVQKARANR